MTSMELPGREMGQRAADMILEDIEAADDEKPSVQHMVFGTKLIERDDVGKDSQMGIFQTVDKLGVGDYAQHHFSFKTSFLFIFFKINKNLAVFQPRFSRIFASFFKFMHAKVSPVFISIRAFPTCCVYRNPCCSFAVPKIRSMVSFLNW